MRTRALKSKLVRSLMATATVLVLAPSPAGAHCDTLDGPVVADARIALGAGDVTPVLKWVAPDREAEIRATFAEALRVRDLGPEARALADRFFFETVVRVHRAGEGAPYTGLKPAETVPDPAIRASDSSLESGDAEPLVGRITHQVEEGLRQRHERALEARAHAGESVERGRDYVAAYVDLMHYAETLLATAGRAPRGADRAHSH
jgi:hypothetical protein